MHKDSVPPGLCGGQTEPGLDIFYMILGPRYGLFLFIDARSLLTASVIINKVRQTGAHAFEINFSGRQRGFDGVLYNVTVG